MSTRHGSAVVTTPSESEILITRTFEAPRALVWETLTTPAYVLRWWGPEWAPIVACEIDLRVGGSWRYVCRAADGSEMGWHGTYRSVEAPGRVVSTEVFEGYPDAESVTTMTLTEADGVTTLQTLVQHSSREHRDGHLESGMEPGMQQTFDRLDDLLELAPGPAEQFRRVARRFTECAESVPAGAWDRPSPCEGWTARDVVRHMVEWMPSFLTSIDVALPSPPAVDDDPVAAWRALAAAIQAVLDDPAVADRTFTHEHLGSQTVAHGIASIMVGDIVIHTWDVARATGVDDTLPDDVVHVMLRDMAPMDEMLRASGHFGPRVDVPDDADEQARLIAFTGRRP